MSVTTHKIDFHQGEFKVSACTEGTCTLCSTFFHPYLNRQKHNKKRTKRCKKRQKMTIFHIFDGRLPCPLKVSSQ